MNKILSIFGIALFLTLWAVPTVSAQSITTTPETPTPTATSSSNNKQQLREEMKTMREDFRKEMKTTRDEFRTEMKTQHDSFKEEMKASRSALWDNLKSLKDTFTGKVARIVNGEVTAVNGTSFTLSKDGKSYTVNTDSETKFRRHFWGSSSLTEIAVGNKVTAMGTWTDEEKTVMDADYVRNLSVMKRFGVFFGTVLSVNGSTFVIDPVKREDQSVSTSATTKFINRRQQAITLSDIKVGDKVRVRGLWDKSANTLTDVTQVKNFSLPDRQASGTATVTPTVTVTVTPTTTPTNTPTPTP